MNQFRKHNKQSIRVKLINWLYRYKIGALNIKVFFDAKVHLMRYPRNIFLEEGVYIKYGARLCPCNPNAKIRVGKFTTIGYDTKIFSSGSIAIGNNCMIAPNVYIVDSDHGMEKDSLMNLQENIVDKILIDDDVWIGAGAVILKGTKIAQGCVIAANSVVKGELEAYSIYGGVPAKKIGKRG